MLISKFVFSSRFPLLEYHELRKAAGDKVVTVKDISKQRKELGLESFIFKMGEFGYNMREDAKKYGKALIEGDMKLANELEKRWNWKRPEPIEIKETKNNKAK